jgi:hypothetical protein
MKKLLITALLLGTTSAFAITTLPVSIPINGTVISDCILGTATVGIATFNYTASAVPSVSGVVNGTATVQCNKGTAPSPLTAVTGTIGLTSGVNTLNTSYSITGALTTASSSASTPDIYTFTLVPSALDGLWGVPSGLYTGTVVFNVTF